MQTARNKLDNSVQSAQQYQNLSPEDLAKWREQASCPGCPARAYYRGPTRNGRAPCFCGHHEEGCEFATNQSATAKSKDSGAQHSFSANPWQRIVVDLAYGVHQANHPIVPRGCESHPPECNHSAERSLEGNPETRRRPSSLLNELVYSPEFSESSQPLWIDGLGGTTVADFFVRLDRCSRGHIHQFHGYWGQIANTRFGPTDELWLNSVGFGYPNVLIPRDQVGEFHRRNRIDHLNQFRLERAYMLVIGVLKLSREGILYIEVTELANLAVSLPSGD